MDRKRPVLVTYRSALELRDAGMAYAYHRAGVVAGPLVAITSVAVAFGLDREMIGVRDLVPVLYLLGVLALALAFWCAKKRSFPQFARLTFDELDAMESDMGLNQTAFEETCESILVGSYEDHSSVDAAAMAIRKAAQASRG